MEVSKPVRNLVMVCFVLGMVMVLALMAMGRNYDAFAQCLSSKDVKMFGKATCPACEEQKERFGKSFSYVKYVACTDMEEDCKDLQYLPTWEFSDGGQIVGVQELRELARLSGCKI